MVGLVPRHRRLPPTVRQIRILGQLLQLPAQVGGLVHALLLRNLEDHVFFQQLLNAFLVCVPVLVQKEGRGEDAAWGTLWTARAPVHLPSFPQDEGPPCTCPLPKTRLHRRLQHRAQW